MLDGDADVQIDARRRHAGSQHLQALGFRVAARQLRDAGPTGQIALCLCDPRLNKLKGVNCDPVSQTRVCDTTQRRRFIHRLILMDLSRAGQKLLRQGRLSRGPAEGAGRGVFLWPADEPDRPATGVRSGKAVEACATPDQTHSVARAKKPDLCLPGRTVILLLFQPRVHTSGPPSYWPPAYPFGQWTENFGSERLTHHVHILEMNSESY